MTLTYGPLQWGGWLTLYAVMALVVYNRPVFVETELLYGAVLLGSTGLGSHLLRGFYRRKVTQSVLPVQVAVLVSGSVLFAALATLLLLLTFFALSVSGYSFPIPADQRWFVIKTVFSGNFVNMLMALLFWSAVYFAITKVRQLRQTTALLHASQLDALINQLNPHFLFNAINNIRALILENPDRARAMLAALSDMLRYNLNQQDGVKVTLQQELTIVHNYIALCSIQFEQRLQYREQIASNCNSILLPKLLLQLCVENAVKHGISKLASGGEVMISARLAGPEVVLQVSNHGSLTVAGDKHSTVGLKNIRQRLQLLYQDKASIQLYQRGQKVITEIRLPLET